MSEDPCSWQLQKTKGAAFLSALVVWLNGRGGKLSQMRSRGKFLLQVRGRVSFFDITKAELGFLRRYRS